MSAACFAAVFLYLAGVVCAVLADIRFHRFWHLGWHIGEIRLIVFWPVLRPVRMARDLYKYRHREDDPWDDLLPPSVEDWAVADKMPKAEDDDS